MNGSLSLNFKNNSHLPLLYGERNSNLQFIEKALGVIILSRGSYIAITGEDDNVRVAAAALEALYHQIENGNKDIGDDDIKMAIKAALDNSGGNKSSNVHTNEYVIKTRKKTVFPYTDNQKKYLKLLHEKDMVFGVGVAGTGKTYLAVATAVSLFLEKKVNKIILCRPAVEAGEKLGFLPGDIKDKVDPYLQPLYDALYDMLPVENIERYMATKEIQIAPLAFMRGRTLSNAFVILDEAQNATPVQMKMFLTRLGYGSKMAITGDLTQIDLHGQTSGLIDAIEKLKHLKDVAVVNFGIKDVVRHPLTAKIIEAYEQG
jgi:phosphate starvation-inducible protein PhoH and related proteins